MSMTETSGAGGLLASILSDESFHPAEPRTLEETGVSPSIVQALVLKLLLMIGSSTGRNIADRICIPFGLLDGVLKTLRQRQLVIHTGSAALNDYTYALTDLGQERAKSAMETNGYVGPAPVPLDDYVVAVEAQSIRAEAPRRENLEGAFQGLSVERDLFDHLGPAVNSGAGMFMYGAPGNGKTTLATRITSCFGQDIWIPRTIIEDGQFIKLFDASFHVPVEQAESSILKANENDHRWVKIKRPSVVVGGELTMDNLEIRHDPRSNVSEAPLQMKSNCGCLLIDDFGRQRMEPQELLNRWIVPLENRVDYLTIATGKKIQVPFEQLIIFSTNLEPADLTDDAFLRRIPYKIEIGDPDEAEFHKLFQLFCRSFGCEYNQQTVDYLIQNHYRPINRALRRCHPRDLLGQIRNYCTYNDLEMEMLPEHFDRVVNSYFTVLSGE
jgi:predicted ATPase with chaperone activity